MKNPPEKPPENLSEQPSGRAAMDRLLPHLPAIAAETALRLASHAGEPVGFGLVIYKDGCCHLIANTGNSGELRAALKVAVQPLPKAGHKPDYKPEKKLH